MTYLVIIALVGIVAGIAIALQAPLASLINQRLGVLESVFIVHVGGALGVGVPLLAMGGGKLGRWSELPWYVLLAGLLGIVAIGATVYMVPRIGVVGAVILIIAGQFTTATAIDHFGILGIDAVAISPQRLLGLVTIFVGVWLSITASAAPA